MGDDIGMVVLPTRAGPIYIMEGILAVFMAVRRILLPVRCSCPKIIQRGGAQAFLLMEGL